jgi:hypothetical protein
MKLFEMKQWQLTVSSEVWGLSAFKKLLDRDKSKNKTRANSELLFIFYFCDIKSDYLTIKEDLRIEELKHDIVDLGPDWIVDDDIKAGIDLYKKISQTVIGKLYSQSLQSATDVGDYLENTAVLLTERDNQGKPITKIADITRGLKDVKFIMRDLKAAEKELIKEQEDNENKKKGAKSFNAFEDGFN